MTAWPIAVRPNVTEPKGWTWAVARQVNQLLLAISFMSRLPVPHDLHYRTDIMHSALRYFPLVGWIVAGLLVMFWLVLSPWLGALPTVCLLLMASLLLTGALHEDGLADCFDGFYGGFDRERKLTIMKDSRLGTYGTSALVMMLLTRLVLLWSLAQHELLLAALCLAYPLSRALAITHAQDLTYVSAPGTSKSDPLARPLSSSMLVQLLLFGGVGFVLLPWPALVAVIPACVLTRTLLKHWMFKHIGGFTGDSLGAAQQFQEMCIYLVLLALANQGWLAAGGLL